MQKKSEYVSHGASFSGTAFYIGLVLVFISLSIFNTMHFALPLVLLLIGIVLFVNFSGIEINYTKGEIREAHNYVFFKTGKWISIAEFDKVLLTNSNEAIRLISPAHPMFQKEITFRSYDVYLGDSSRKHKPIYLGGSKTIKNSQVILSEYAKKLVLPKDDLIKKNWNKNKGRRR